MNTIDTVTIENFWGDKKVVLKFREDVNFLIGVNGSGKTTIINLIAATLKADFTTLDRFNFSKIKIALKPQIEHSVGKQQAFIEVEKTEKSRSPFPNIIFKIKRYEDKAPKEYFLDELEEEHLIRYPREYVVHRRIARGDKYERDVNLALTDLVSVSWLSIHRTSAVSRRREERSFESTIDLKIEELQIDLVKYFSQLNRKYTIETENFQKYIFESLIDKADQEIKFERNVNVEREKHALTQIFRYFKISEKSVTEKLDSYFTAYQNSLLKIQNREELELNDFTFLIGTQKIQSVLDICS